MILTGHLQKSGSWWVIECEALDATTQGKTQAEAKDMLAAWIRDMLDRQDYDVVVSGSGNAVEVHVSDLGPILGLMVDRQRQAAGLTVAGLAKASNQKSTGAISGYTSGKHEPSLSKLSALLKPMGYQIRVELTPAPKRRRGPRAG